MQITHSRSFTASRSLFLKISDGTDMPNGSSSHRNHPKHVCKVASRLMVSSSASILKTGPLSRTLWTGQVHVLCVRA